MKDCKGVQDFCNRVTEIVNQIKVVETPFEAKKLNEKVMRCLPLKFDHAAAIIEKFKGSVQDDFFIFVRIITVS